MKHSFALHLLGALFLVAGCGGPNQDVDPTDDVGVGGVVGNGTGATASGGGSTVGSGGLTAAGGSGSGGVVATGGTGTSTGGTTSTSCGPEWVEGQSYVVGDIVHVESTGLYYIAENDNPGYEPWTSTWFWEPYTCTTQGTGGGNGTGGTTSSTPFSDIFSEAQFNQLFPNRNAFYTYQGLVAATAKYPAFAGTGSDDVKKREVAAFLANVTRETGHLVYIEQIAKEPYCASSANCPCEPGKQYYGRGPIQISWNYNYCSAGDALGYDLRKNPDLVAQSAEIAWATGLWFWMTQEGAGYYTPHEGITGGHGFGETIRSINGGQECGGKWPEAVQERAEAYRDICDLLGVSYGDNVTC